MRDIFSDKVLREEIAEAVTKTFGHKVVEEDVLDVARYGSVSEGVVGEDFDEAKTEAILAELDQREIRT